MGCQKEWMKANLIIITGQLCHGCVVGLYKQKSFQTNSLCHIAHIDGHANNFHDDDDNDEDADDDNEEDDDDDDDNGDDEDADDDDDTAALLVLVRMQILFIMWKRSQYEDIEKISVLGH